MSDLVLGNKYYVRAYAINGKGPAYSNQISFSTVASLPALSMYSVDHLDADNKTAILHGSVDYIGDPAYTERGFVYAQNKNTPTLSDSHVKSEGSGIGTFAASISGLEFGKVYYARAYAINEGGPAYSKDSVMFTLTWTKPEVSVGETTEIDLSKPSAVLHGSLDKVGSPATTERGFVYSSTNNIPTINDNVIPVNGLTEGSYYYRIESLTLSKTYYVRAYAKNEIDVFYSANVTSFSTMPSLPVVSMRATPNLNLNSKTITLQGSVDYLGDPAYTEKGFVYSTTNQEPSINDAIIVSAGNGIGVFEATLDGLVLNKDYYVRAYIKNVSGVSYSDTILSFSTQPSLPSVSMRAVQNINREALTALLQGIVDDIGTPSFSEKGFVYSSTNDTPTLNDNFIKVEGASAGGYETTLNNLVLGATYYVRAYAINAGGTSYSENVIQFSISGTTPVVNVSEADNINLTTLSATLHASVEDMGYPAITEKGFVVSDVNQVPTINDKVIQVSGLSTGLYYSTISELSLNKTYYVRAYVRNVSGVIYSSKTVTFTTTPTKPTVTMRTVSNINREALSALLQGSVDNTGDPSFTEKGFVYSSTNDTPTLNDNFIKVEGASAGGYEATLNNLVLGSTYYVRSYAINAGGTSYSENVIQFNISGTTPVVNVSEADNINLTTLSATLHASVEDIGYPAITEKGFVVSDVNQVPTINDKVIQVSGLSTGLYYSTISELSLNKTYYVRAYVRNESGVIYSSKTVTFTTIPTKPTVTMRTVSNINRETLSALLQGFVDNAGDPSFTEKGFVYSSTNDTPTLNDNFIKVEGASAGGYETTLDNLVLGTTYYVRAYAINAGGTSYSENVIQFEIKGTTPVVSISAASNVNVTDLSATLNGVVEDLGYPNITEKGFVYGYSSSTPTINDNMVPVGDIKLGSYSANISELTFGKLYYARSYARNTSGLYYSEKIVSFSMEGSLPSIEIRQATNINLSLLSAEVTASITDGGTPLYSEKGFVYSDINTTPTLENDHVIKVGGSTTGVYSTTLTELTLGKTYYVRAYSINRKGTSYSSTISFFIGETLPEVVTEAATNVDDKNLTAVLHASITNAGNPSYTERGFVLSTDYEEPTIYDTKIEVAGTGVSSYEYRLTDFSTTKMTYVRAYAINSKGVAYGKTVILYKPEFVDKGDYIILNTLRLEVQKTDIGRGTWESMNALCNNSSLNGHTDWRLPTKDELAAIYNLRDIIGGFTTTRDNVYGHNVLYWTSSTPANTLYSYYMSFYDGSYGSAEKNVRTYSDLPARAVRTITE